MSDFRRSLPVACLAAVLLAGCAGKPAPAWRNEQFDADSPFQFHSDLPPLMLCELGKRALLSQGYEVDSSAPQSIRGAKHFQPESEYLVQLRLTLVCMPGKEDSMIYANALQTRYELKSSGSSTGLSVTGFGSISLPWPTDKSSLVKVGEETVTDPEFYRRLFTLIDTLQQ
ncbi:DUF2242 domain-containing protein [Azonexus sp. R2A61]|uniref:DUF2242 domain-containing protein n=1 Tax=Azonexus sp. R2A61 TaxID=2744443 RepID=UPI001F1C54BB|nr:DUF2242 domain-containing protein [Azonexus sp. R2A61]